MKAIAIIPARYGSTRFLAKALAPLLGKPLIQWVWDAVLEANLFAEVIIATDSQVIMDAVVRFGGKAVLTRADHHSGSDRISEVASNLDADVIFNVQGDEPLITTSALTVLLQAFDDPSVQMASLMTQIADKEQLSDPNTVKVVVDAHSNALYFSRASIPFYRDKEDKQEHWRHIGVYAYRRETLLRFVALPVGKLEQIEKLEQLRALENGIPIRMVATDYQGIGIDTPQDLQKVENSLFGYTL